MSVIKCNNKNVVGGVVRECNAFLADISGDSKTWLKENPGINVITLRCHSCVPNQRWIRIYADEEGKIVWDSSGQTKAYGDPMTFDIMRRTEFAE